MVLLALWVIAVMTAPAIRADLASRQPNELAQRDDRPALQGSHGRSSLHSDRRGSPSAKGHGKGGLFTLLPPPRPRLQLPVAALDVRPGHAPKTQAQNGPPRARAPPLIA